MHAVLTLLVGAALAYYFMLILGLGMIFGGGLTASERMLIYATLVLMGFGFLLSYSMRRGVTSKYLWYGAFVYWIALAIFCVSVYNISGAWRYMWYMEGPLSDWYGMLSLARIVVLPTPFIYTVGCSLYFLTRTPRAYFGV
jgi:hypothetical protein